MKKLHTTAQQQAGKLSPADFAAWFNRLPTAHQYELQYRAVGTSVVADDYRTAATHRARQLGVGSTPAHLVHAHFGGQVDCGCHPKNGVGAAGDVVAVEVPISEIYTDPARFQNRVDAFSELSAEAVARQYDPNKFDPVVLWHDPQQNNRAFVLSGHSRLEGMRRRNSDTVAARFFVGTEAEAIKFARVDANRAANAENLVEDLKAYKLMRDGDEQRQLKPAKKAELNRSFKGKAGKLEAWSHLDTGGLFLHALSQENRTEFPYLEKFATWVGQLRAQHAEMTGTMENDCFNFFYSDAKNQKVKHEDFQELVTKRLAWGKPRLFPECGPDGCKDLADLAKRGAHAEAYKELELLAQYKEEINHRLRTTARGQRTYTDEERAKLREQGHLIEEEMKRIRRDLGQAESAPGLFGVGGPADLQRRDGPHYFPRLSIEEGDYRDLEDMLYLIRQHLEAVGYNDQDQYTGFRIYAPETKVARLLLDLEATEPQIVVYAPLPVYLIVLPKRFFGLADSFLRQRRIDYQYQLPK